MGDCKAVHATTTSREARGEPSPVRGLKAPDVLSSQRPGVKRLYWYLAANADQRGFAQLNLSLISEQWSVPRQTLQYHFRKLKRLHLLTLQSLSGF